MTSVVTVLDTASAVNFLDRRLWNPTCGAYQEAIGDRWPCWKNDNYLARIVATKYLTNRLPQLSSFLAGYMDTRWCVLTDAWQNYIPAAQQHGPDWHNYADWLALEAIYYYRLKRSATSIINALLAMFDGVWFTDVLQPGTYKSALGAIAFHLHGKTKEAQQCMTTVSAMQVELLSSLEYGGILTDNPQVRPGEYRSGIYANVETTCLAIIAKDMVSGVAIGVRPLMIGAIAVAGGVLLSRRYDFG